LLTEKVRTVSMKVQLIVVRGKPEGKVIPLASPTFKIGRGETCHLRPNSEQVSREHAEFTIKGGDVIVRDLGSRNGTLVNGKALTTESAKLKDRDLVQVGPLTFAVSIQDAPAPAAAAKSAAAPPPAAAKAKPSLDDVSTDDIDSWLVNDNAAGTADQPTAVYGGDTITIAAFKDAQASPPAPAKPAPPPAPANKPPSVASDDEYERQTEDEEEAEQEVEEVDEVEEVFDEASDEDEPVEDEEEEATTPEEEFMDESNPFYAAKKAQKDQAKKGATTGATGAANATFKDSSDAANEILRKLMERRRASKS
jgi:pSer/pThr/pTyr-binding forkhead associated (FHA) protein